MDQYDALNLAKAQARRHLSEVAPADMQSTPCTYGTAIVRVPTFRFAQFVSAASADDFLDLMGGGSYTLSNSQDCQPVLEVKNKFDTFVIQFRGYLVIDRDGNADALSEPDFRAKYEVVK